MFVYLGSRHRPHMRHPASTHETSRFHAISFFLYHLTIKGIEDLMKSLKKVLDDAKAFLNDLIGRRRRALAAGYLHDGEDIFTVIQVMRDGLCKKVGPSRDP